MPPADSRTSQRVAAPNVMVRVSTAQRFRAVYLKDLSEGGLFIKTERPIAIGQKILVDLLPPGFTVPLRLPAVVVRHAPAGSAQTAGMGVKFETMTPETAQTLSALILSYQTAPTPAPADPVDPASDLEALLEQYSILKTDFDLIHKELLVERERREESARRVLSLAAELEALKTQSGTASTSTSSQTEELKTALAGVQTELADARMRLIELQGNLAAYTEEVRVLETDDAASRQLASVLAHEKLTLARDVERLNAELTRERAQSAARLKELEAKRSENDSSARDLLKSAQADLELQQLAAARQESRADALQTQLGEQTTRQSALAAEVRTLKSENAALTQRVGMAENAAREAATRLDRMKAKERELRQLLSVISGRGEEEVVVVVEQPEEVRDSVASKPAIEAPGPNMEQAFAASALDDIFTDPPEDPPAAAAVAPAAAVTAVAPVAPVAAAPEPVPAVAATADDWDLPAEPLSEDIEFDVEAPVPAEGFKPLSRDDFEKCLRANDELMRTELFDLHETTEPIEVAVKGLLESGPRLSELMVLSRGLATPPKLFEVLYRLHMEGIVKFR